jgi:hypothetical protein
MTAADLAYRWIADAAYTPPPLDCWEWNRRHGRLSSRDSAMPGPWRGEVVPHMHHWQDLVSARRLGRGFMGDRDQYAHLTEQIWLVAGTQSTKTRSLLYAALAHGVDQFPSPKGLILPRLKDFKKVLDNRVKPFFEETPALARHMPSRPSARKVAITYSAWTLDTCTLYMLCGEVADDLRSFPMCELFLDEFDLLPINCEGQGDPIDLVLDRQKTWPRTKLTIGTTTPTTVDGHGWRRLCSGSHERLLIRCPDCGADQELHPDRLRWPENTKPDAIKLHRLATWSCAFCEYVAKDDGTKDRLVTEAAAANRWVPGVWAVSGKHPTGAWTPAADFDERHQVTRIHPPETTVRTGCVNSLYSQFITLSEFAAHEQSAKLKGNHAEWISHLNGWRCEPHIPVTVSPIDMAALGTRATTYGYAMGSCPVDDVRLALVLDQQGNSRSSAWFPYVVRAYGADGETWLVDAGEAKNFEELAVLESRAYQIGKDRKPVDVTVMDAANGMMRVPIQSWAAERPDKRIALVGRFWPDFQWRQRSQGKVKDSRAHRVITGARVFDYHSNSYRTELDERVRAKPGAKKWNLPDDAPTWYLASLTAEEQVYEHIRLPGMPGKLQALVWKPRVVHDETGRLMVRADNHWWDCEVMSIVAADILGWSEPKPKPRHRQYGIIGDVK